MKTARLIILLVLNASSLASSITNHVCQAQTTTSWIAAGSSSDWFQLSNWTNGVPLQAGDVANVPSIPSFSPSIGSTNTVSLGRLAFSGAGAVAIAGNGGLTFSNPGVDPAVISAPGPQALAATIAPALLVSPGELLSIDLGANSSLTLSTGFGEGNGDAAVNGPGVVSLNGGSQNWQGQMTVNAGRLILNSASALGATSKGTIVNGGVVRVNAVVSEPFTLQSGTLETSLHFLDLNGPLYLPADNTATVRGPFVLFGGTTGGGDLRIVATETAATHVRSALNHQGGVKITSGVATKQYATFSADNGYFGPTEVQDVTLEVRTPNGLGSAEAGTTVTRGVLRLHGGSQESVSLSDSTLALWSAETTVDELRPTGAFVLKNSTLTTFGEFRGASNYIVEQPVQLLGGSNTIAAQRGALTLNGGVTGSGNLLFNPTGSSINVAGPIDSTLRPELRGGPLRLSAEDVFGGELFIRNGGRLVIEADQHMSRVRTGALVRSGCCSPFGNIEVAEGASLTAEHVDMTQGLILGSVHTPDGLRFAGFIGGRTISHFDIDTSVRIMAGELEVDDSLAGRSSTRAAINVERAREASVFVGERSITDADFYLNNGSGFNYGGALLAENDGDALPAIVLRGDIHLGSNGAHIGGTDHLRIQGQIYGGDLNLGRRRGTPGLIIESGPAAYTGVSRVYSGELIVAENGRLSETSAIELFAEGSLYVDNRPVDGPASDRIADDVPIRMFGGQLSTFPTEWGMNVRERVGKVSLERGVSVLRGAHYYSNSLQSHADLVIGEIARQPGAVLSLSPSRGRSSSAFTFGQGSGTPDFLLENRPQLVNGILPAWIINNVTFTTYDQSGRVKSYDGPLTDLAVATNTSIARPSVGGTTLAADKTIHALYGFGNAGPVNLNGHTLTIGSGGVSGATLTNGAIRPGEFSNGELIFFGGNTVGAAIEDNIVPTSVVYAGDAEISGSNSYTGMTYVVGNPGDTVTVTNYRALPNGADVDISGYSELHLRDLSGNSAYALGDVAIHDGAALSIGCCGNGDTLTAKSIVLEGGRLAAPLVGNMPITKQTEGAAIISQPSPGFTGNIEVLEGTLQAGEGGSYGYLAFGSGTVDVLPQGRLALTSINAPTNAPTPKIRLKGGSLFGIGNAGDSGINLRGALDVLDDSAIYLLDGSLDRPRASTIRIDGSIHVAAGKSLSILGRPDDSVGLHVTQGFQLDEGAILAGDGVIRAQIDISRGAILSPGLVGQDAKVGLLATDTPSRVVDLPKSRMVWGDGGRYRWEINGAEGDAGAPFGRGWDVMRIGSILDITATPSAPFILEPVPLGNSGEPGAVAGLIPNRQYRWLIAEIGKINAFSATITGFAADKFAIDLSKFRSTYPNVRSSDFWLDLDSDGIHLNAKVVPEPACFALVIVALGTFFQCRRAWRPNGTHRSERLRSLSGECQSH